MKIDSLIDRRVSLRRYTTLNSGGEAEYFAITRSLDDMVELARTAERQKWPITTLGWGSNILPSDAGVKGLVIRNETRTIEIEPEGDIQAECGCSFQELFLKTAQAKLAGFEYAVGIPGSLGGALVSNAGAYRSNVSEFLTELEIYFEGERKWVAPSFMEFAYRDSILRRPSPPQCLLLQARFKLPIGDSKSIYDEAREYQRQRISKQPPSASAGSFFKNVNDPDLAVILPTLPQKLKESGVVPAGFLLMEAGVSGLRHGGAIISRRHANFIVNVGGATASEIRQLAEIGKKAVYDRFGVELEEEVLYLGDWTGYSSN